jgi:CheY-like chemotaxis protein
MHTILIVDDDFDCCSILGKLLTKLGETALCVTSGQLALDSLQLRQLLAPYLAQPAA